MVATFGQLKAFNAVARAGSLTRAAHRLAISPPAITAQVRRLEADHDVVLFEHTPAGLQLTAIGRRLFRITQNLDDMEEAAAILLGGGDDIVPPVVRLSTASPQVFMPIVAAFRRTYPDVEVDLKVGGTGEAVRLLLDREVDIALTPVVREDDRLESMIFLNHRLTALVPADHPLSRLESATLAQIVGEPLITRAGLSTTQKVVDQAFAMHGLRQRPVLRLETREAVHEAVANGIGVSLVLERDVPPDARFRTLPLVDVDVGTSERVVWLRSRRALGPVRDFIAVAERVSARRTAGAASTHEHDDPAPPLV
ncbi:LysR family transcriptional regulator [Roseospira visakhapatnamensis]|uniref:DNA-binding transcriptional LysR family regulator n=1 Tax=Roseospira visakhapatnamensis TaxID=390880 RepID=A0A7W6RE24_9PROT|nr:LysR family transcriptional regulator [Roseospira visakhapatnamensis]MBB4266737.1 DNA-binding transcriptional LysR family regulator [Roseospira visakhapatnamensis]